MGKARYPVSSRSSTEMYDHIKTYWVTIPMAMVQQMAIEGGDVLEFVFVTEGEDSFMKVRFAKDD
jgi:hypothetical protein